MAEDPDCREAYNAAIAAAASAAEALGIQPANLPLVKELETREAAIPNTSNGPGMADIRKAFREKMKQLQQAAERQAAAAKPAPKPVKSLADTILEAQKATERALEAAKALEAARKELKAGQT